MPGLRPVPLSHGPFGWFQVAAAEGKGRQDDSSDSRVENEVKRDLLLKNPAWVDEDDEAEEM